MQIDEIITVIILVLEVILCFVVYYASIGSKNDEQKLIRHRFYLFNVSMALWGLGKASYAWLDTAYAWDIMYKIGSIITIVLAVSYLLFAKALTREKISKLNILYYSFLSLFSLAVISFFELSKTENISGTLNTQVNPLYGGLVTILPIILIVHGVIVLEKFAKRNKNSDDKTSTQARYVSRGMIFTLAVVFICNYVFAGSDSSLTDVVAALAPLAFVLVIAFSVFSLKLFNFSSFLYKSIAYLAALTVIFIIYTGVAILVATYILDINLSTRAEILLAVFSAITALLFQPLKRFFDKFTNKIFYKDSYDNQELLNKVNSSLVGETDLYKLLSNTADSVHKNLKVEFCNFYIDEEAALDFHVAGTDAKVFGNENWSKIVKKVTDSKLKIISEIDSTEDISKLLSGAKIGAVVKMTSQDQDVGYIITGQKLSGNKYTNDDVQIIEIIADEVAIAVQNTLRFEEIAQFNITLQKRIEDATAQLQKTNEKLVALDEAKDEFISMASHQLRTPLTSIKGYLSMMQEGDAGELNDQQRNFVDQAFLSSQRMVYLIADLLNVSRLKTGKFVIEAKPTYLPDVVEGELAQLTETVKARNLEMVFDKPTEFPVMNLDETKVRQVIMNFADNAIYYTPSGGKITVKLEADENNVTYSVTDTGIGVPKSEQHKLFTKFYRAGNARKARPDGTGLGLFMAKKVVVAQGGSIIFKTTEGKGSTFGFSFPRTRLELKDTPAPKAEEAALV
jgi:signal transduction histidine kinase